MEEFLEMVKPDMSVLNLCETRWKNEWGVPDIGKGNYNRSDKGGGVMVLTSKRVSDFMLKPPLHPLQ